MHFQLYPGLTEESFPLGADLVPLEEHVSNAFEVEGGGCRLRVRRIVWLISGPFQAVPLAAAPVSDWRLL